MIAFRFKNVCIESFAVNLPPTEVTSAEIEDSLAPVYNRLQIPFGTLERLSGVKTRRLWDPKIRPSEVATVAAKEALERSGLDPKMIRGLLSCSVTRDYFEPATAAIVHRNLGLEEEGVVFDISNACVGFSNGLTILGNLIETGVVKAGIVVSGENINIIVQNNIRHILNSPNLTREEMLKLLPTFTLGCGAVAYVLCHESISKSKHRLVGAATHCASQFNDLCNGSTDFPICDGIGDLPLMRTESSKLILSAAKLGGVVWKEASEVLGWSREDVDHVFCHQVGKQVNEAFYADMGLDMNKEFTIYKNLGNMVSAALPTCLALGSAEKKIKSGEKVVLTGFGSGLNAIFSGIVW